MKWRICSSLSLRLKFSQIVSFCISWKQHSTDRQTNHLIMLNNKSGDRDVDKFPSFTRYFVAPDCRRLSQKDLRNNLLYYGCVNINLLWHYTASILWMWLRLELQLRLMGRRSVRCVRHVIRLDSVRRGEGKLCCRNYENPKETSTWVKLRPQKTKLEKVDNYWLIFDVVWRRKGLYKFSRKKNSRKQNEGLLFGQAE